MPKRRRKESSNGRAKMKSRMAKYAGGEEIGVKTRSKSLKRKTNKKYRREKLQKIKSNDYSLRLRPRLKKIKYDKEGIEVGDKEGIEVGDKESIEVGDEEKLPVARYEEMESSEKSATRSEYIAYVYSNYTPGKRILFLDGPALKTLNNLVSAFANCGAKLDMKDIFIIEIDQATYEEQGRAMKFIPGGLEVNHICGNIWDYFESLANNGNVGEEAKKDEESKEDEEFKESKEDCKEYGEEYKSRDEQDVDGGEKFSDDEKLGDDEKFGRGEKFSGGKKFSRGKKFGAGKSITSVIGKSINNRNINLIWLDLMCASITDEQLSVLRTLVVRGQIEFLFLTLSARLGSSESCDDQEERINNMLTIPPTEEKAKDGFGLVLKWNYKRASRSQTMRLFIFSRNPPAEPLYRPHKILARLDEKLYLLKWYGTTETSILHHTHEAVQLLLKQEKEKAKQEKTTLKLVKAKA